jgi:hypothetical protein
MKHPGPLLKSNLGDVSAKGGTSAFAPNLFRRRFSEKKSKGKNKNISWLHFQTCVANLIK